MNNKEKIVEMRKILVDDMGEDVAKKRIFNQKNDFEMMKELANCKKGYQAERIFNDYSKTIIRSLWNSPYKIISRIWFKKQNLRFKDFEVTTKNKEGIFIHDEVDIKYQCRQHKLQLNREYFDEVINIVENQTMNVGNKYIIFFMFDKSNTGKTKVVRKSWTEIKQLGDKLTYKGKDYVQLDYDPEDILNLDIENFYLDEIIEWEQKFIYQDEANPELNEQLLLTESKGIKAIKNKNLQKLHVNIDAALHKKFKIFCAQKQVTFKSTIEGMIKKELCIS